MKLSLRLHAENAENAENAAKITRRNLFYLSSVFALFLHGCSITPQPLNSDEIQSRAYADMKRIFAIQAPTPKKIDLFTAMAHAMRYNLDARVKRMEQAVAHGQFDLASLETLPQLALSAGYSHRDNTSASTSKSLDGPSSGVFSTSQKKGSYSGDLSMAWNVLDFGVSYLQATQESNQPMILQEQRRRTLQNVLQDVRFAYWRALTSEELLPEMIDLLEEIQAALERSRTLEKTQTQKPMKALEYQQGLLENLQELWAMRTEIAFAKSELASLIGLKPGTSFTLHRTGWEELPLHFIEMPMERLEMYALSHRPELQESDYQERIDRLEIRKAMLGLLPGPSLSIVGNHNDTPYMLHQNWVDVGMRLTWGLLNWISVPARVRSAQAQVELTQVRRLTVSMAVLTQLHLAKQRHNLAKKTLHVAEELDQLHQRMLQHSRSAKKAATGTGMEMIRKKVEAFKTKMQHSIAVADFQDAAGRIYHSLGVNPISQESHFSDLNQLARALRAHQTRAFGISTTTARLVAPLVAPPSTPLKRQKNRQTTTAVVHPTVTRKQRQAQPSPGLPPVLDFTHKNSLSSVTATKVLSLLKSIPYRVKGSNPSSGLAPLLNFMPEKQPGITFRTPSQKAPVSLPPVSLPNVLDFTHE